MPRFVQAAKLQKLLEEESRIIRMKEVLSRESEKRAALVARTKEVLDANAKTLELLDAKASARDAKASARKSSLSSSIKVRGWGLCCCPTPRHILLRNMPIPFPPFAGLPRNQNPCCHPLPTRPRSDHPDLCSACGDLPRSAVPPVDGSKPFLTITFSSPGCA
jgi:hypothetical protein